jgi:hypothetical protein
LVGRSLLAEQCRPPRQRRSAPHVCLICGIKAASQLAPLLDGAMTWREKESKQA